MKIKHFTIITILSLVFFSCKRNIEDLCNREIYCDMEQSDVNGNFFLSRDKQFEFSGASNKSSVSSKSGESSILLSKKNSFGLTIDIDNIAIGDNFEISIWRYGGNSGVLVVSDPNNEYFYIAENKANIKEEDEWEQIFMSFHIPLTYYGNQLKLYVWNNEDQDVYFDDLKIVQKCNRVKHEVYFDTIPALKIQITDESYNKLEIKRKEAINKGILESSSDDYVPALIMYKTDTLKGKIRLKGDWLDHLSGKKWSFRIKLKKKYSWKGMRTFSIHNPNTRCFLYEWLTHRIFEKEDVLTTRYGFVPVILNGKNLGLYAFEEHMTKNLLEYNRRREGPILKLNEDLNWYVQSCAIKNQKQYRQPILDAATIEPFQESRTTKSPVLQSQFNKAKELLYQFKYGLEKPSDIYDLEKLAMYYAIIDLTRSHHAVVFHNQRFYYNPITAKLEPIAFDCYGGKVTNWPSRSIYGNFDKNKEVAHYSGFIFNIFHDKDFVNAYIKALERLSDPEYITEVLNENKNEIDIIERIIQIEFTDYTFDKYLYINGAKRIQNELQSYLSNLDKMNFAIPFVKEEILFDTIIDNYIHSYNIKCYREEIVDNQTKVKLVNFSSSSIRIIGEGEDQKNSSLFDIPSVVKPIYSKENYTVLNILKESKYIFFQYLNNKKVFCIPIIEWSCPTGKEIPRQAISEKYNVINAKNSNIIVSNGVVSFRKGNIQLNKPVFIPSGYIVKINEGSEIDLINKASIISFSPIYIIGKSKNPVVIHSSDGTSMGVNIFCTDKRSEFNNVVFSQLNTLNYEGWMLTGAVNLYESDVNISNTVFKNNRCEDALNIIRSDFSITNCSFDNIFADAFDADFCTGDISRCNFRDINNDAIDFSGSNVKISNCSVLNVNDKGVSGGEDSELDITDCIISYCNLGVAAKDLSKLNVKNCTISNCKYGVAAFQKKAEFGNARIELYNVEMKNINTEFCIEEESLLLLNSQEIIGTEKDVSKIFY